MPEEKSVLKSDTVSITDFGFKEEIAEDFNVQAFGAYVMTGFPSPRRRYRLIYESERASIEETYYWVLNACTQDFGFGDVIKTVDTFAASENSSFWGNTHQRQSIQQDRATQYLATIGRMVKEIFPMVREIRMIKERIQHYEGFKRGRQADDVALKSYWSDLVEGGKQGQMNIYQLAQQVGFGSLPDLFFKTYVREGADVAEVVDRECKDFNDKVTSVLKQKLAKYDAWRKETEIELRTRERFLLRHLRQHWMSIRMYVSWVKPYLKNVQKLQEPDKYDQNAELVSSFEGAIIEIEFLAKRAPDKGVFPVILATFTYRVKPQMEFHEKGGYQHRGPVHIGRIEYSLRSYGWTQGEIDKYLEFRQAETLKLLHMVDGSIADAMDEMGEELRKYLKEAGQDVEIGKAVPKDEKKDAPPKVNMLEPFTALFGGFKEIFMLPFGGISEALKPEKKDDLSKEKGSAAKTAENFSFQVYKNYKKAHGPMPTW